MALLTTLESEKKSLNSDIDFTINEELPELLIVFIF
jgi:hypothetical protein